MPTPTQPWLRAELIAAPETTPGAQLMIPADGIEFHDGQLVFHHQGDVVYVAPQGQLRSITWFARQPHPETARRKAQWPNHGTRWTDEERTELHSHLRAGHSWKAISHAHGRSRTGCQQEAVKQGWLDGETMAPTARLLGGEGTQTDVVTQTDAKADGALAGAPTDPTPSLVLAAAAVADPAAVARETRLTDTESQPDRPQIPHQRSDSADTPDPEKDAPPGPGSRFLSLAQSSLARAALGAYMNPPRAT